MKFSAQQDRALVACAEWLARWRSGDREQQVFYLAGFAGSGKTTLAKHLAADVDGRVLFCAYTGKAAHVLASKGCRDATTIHRMIYQSAGDPPTKEQIGKLRDRLVEARRVCADASATAVARQLAEDESRRLADHIPRLEQDAQRSGPRFKLNPCSDAAFAALIVADECSMIDGRVGTDLESFGVPILVLGDPAQLAPVGGGGHFTNREPDVLLDEVHRQGKDSPILWLATQIRNRRRIDFGNVGPGCDVLRYGSEGILERAVSADQILVGRNKTRHATNDRMRALRGHTTAGGGTALAVPQTGERVICLRNDHEAGLMNGSLWDVETAHGGDETVSMAITSAEDPRTRVAVCAWLAHFSGREAELQPFTRRDYQEFAFGYAITVHKAQGSAWPSVIVFDESSSFQDGWRHLYTACTRASEQLTLVQ